MTPSELIAFETDIAAEFNAGNIRAPVHLSDGNEAQLIEVFKTILHHDWICCSWRCHYHCLLKGVPPAALKGEIMAGRSIALCFPEQRIVSSAILGGNMPIGIGLAMGIKRAGGAERVHIFIGDMTWQSGIAHETMKYAANHMLNVRFIVEDNGISVCTPTAPTWGFMLPGMEDGAVQFNHYRYQSRYPHAGSGKRIEF
jgi:pyruvate dehydrogenase E1 component alpha subunit